MMMILGDLDSSELDQQQVWKANLDPAPLGTSYSGGSTDRVDDDHQTITLNLNPALPASLLAPGLPRQLLSPHQP